MPDPAWPSSPPEANYLRLAGGAAAGTATTVANAAAWQALMGSNEAAFSVSTLSASATAPDFEGVGGVSSSAAIAGLNEALQLMAGWVQEKPPVAISAVSAYETAVSSMIPAAVSLANRAEQAADVALNPVVLGALTPAIVALDVEYFGEHWPHNAAVGAAYGAALAGLTAALAVPPPISPPGASATGPVTAAAAMAQTAGQVAAGEAMKESGQAVQTTGDSAAAPMQATAQLAAAQPLQAAMSAGQPITGMFHAPMQALQSASGLPQAMANSIEGGFDGVAASDTLVAPGMPTAGNLPGANAGGLGGSVGPGIGPGSPAPGGTPGAGLTTYTRPNSSFAQGESGRPVGLKTGLLSTAAQPGMTTNAGPGMAGLPVAPAQNGMLRSAKAEPAASGVTQARVAVPDTGDPEGSGQLTGDALGRK